VRIIKKILFTLILISIFGCAKEKVQPKVALDEREKHHVEVQLSLAMLKNSNPDSLAQKAIMADSIYFICVYGYAIEVPGVNDYEERYQNKVPVRVIPGTSDALYSEEDKELAAIANNYAKRFNGIILNHLKK
jgi:hypothetical protein